MIRFAASGSLLVVATYDGRMIKIFNEKDGTLINQVTRGAAAAVIGSISLR